MYVCMYVCDVPPLTPYLHDLRVVVFRFLSWQEFTDIGVKPRHLVSPARLAGPDRRVPTYASAFSVPLYLYLRLLNDYRSFCLQAQ